MKRTNTTMKKLFLLNYKGNKYRANTLLGILWNFTTGKTSK